jgi:hypothetical protein
MNAKFTPGVTFNKVPIQVFATGNFGGCQSAEFPKITGGTFSFGADGPGVCTGPLAIGSGAAVDISWNDGSYSTARKMSFYVELGSWSFNGVLKGRFEGQTVRASGRATKPGTDMGLECRRGGLIMYPATVDSLVVG